jgi:hypothetical protein
MRHGGARVCEGVAGTMGSGFRVRLSGGLEFDLLGSIYLCPGLCYVFPRLVGMGIGWWRHLVTGITGAPW